MKYRVEIVVRAGAEQLARIEGRVIDGSTLTIDDSIGKIIEMEHALERMTGHRFHINMHPVQESDLPSIGRLDKLLEEEREARGSR